jgi:hypothetical protein
MRSFLEPGRRRRRSDRFQAKLSRNRTGWGGKKLIRFRRNRALLAKELTSAVLWLAIAISLVSLGRTLWRVGSVHFAEGHSIIRWSLPGLAAVACVASIVRARKSLLEFLDIRREQSALAAELREQPPEDPA